MEAEMGQEDIGVAMARKCSTAALLAVLGERGYEAVPATVGPAVSRVVDAGRALDGEDATRWTRAQAAFYEATKRLLGELAATPETVERTPETVLRTMLRAYEEAALGREVSYWSKPDDGDVVAEAADHALVVQAREATDDVRSALGQHLAGKECQFIRRRLLSDYKMRLDGQRPLDAPPPEAP